jgi:hypothetical protein
MSLLCVWLGINLACVNVDSGNGTNEILSARMFHLLLQSLVRMKISVNDGTEMFSVSVCHEASGTCSH